MARFVTPSGVVIEMSEEAALKVGYKPAQEKAAADKAAPRSRAKKTDK